MSTTVHANDAILMTIQMIHPTSVPDTESITHHEMWLIIAPTWRTDVMMPRTFAAQ